MANLSDQMDLQIISALRANPRATNKQIAERLDAAEATIAQRIRNMAERSVMRVVAQQHVFSAGYTIMSFLFITTHHGAATEVGQKIADIDEVIGVSRGIGAPDLFVNFRARSIDHVNEVTRKIGDIPDITQVETNLCFKIHKFVSNLGILAAEASAPASAATSDEDPFFTVLAADGRQNNSEVARQLGLSEGTIRQRIKKLLQAGTMQFEVVCDTAALGISTVAVVRLSTRPERTAATITQIAQIQDITYIAEVTGPYNILLLVATTDEPTLGELCDNQLRAMDQVEALHVQLLVSNIKHQFQLAHFDRQADIPKRK